VRTCGGEHPGKPIDEIADLDLDFLASPRAGRRRCGSTVSRRNIFTAAACASIRAGRCRLPPPNDSCSRSWRQSANDFARHVNGNAEPLDELVLDLEARISIPPTVGFVVQLIKNTSIE
jgi:hypothetical protein